MITLVITLAAALARLLRLEALALSLGKEVAILKKGEHAGYLKAIQDAISGLAEARAVLKEALRDTRR
jgi:hypothetical protein